jgi:hypothetical protein
MPWGSVNIIGSSGIERFIMERTQQLWINEL